MSIFTARGRAALITEYVNDLDQSLRERGIIGDNVTHYNGFPGVTTVRGQSDNTLDAIRHSYVTGRLSLDFGYHAAVFGGRHHENQAPNSPEAREMDLHNNATGAAYARSIVGAGGNRNHFPEQLLDRILQGAENGDLILYPGMRPRGRLRSDAETQGGAMLAEGQPAGDRQVPYAQAWVSASQGLDALQQRGAIGGMVPGVRQEDVLAGLMQNGAERGMDPYKPVELIPGQRPNEVFLRQGAEYAPEAVIAKIDLAQVQPNSADRVMNGLTARLENEPQPAIAQQISRGPSMA